MFLNLGFVTGTCSLAQTSWYFCPEQRAYPPNETNYPKGLCSSQSYGTTKPKSHSMDPYSCACSRANFRRTFKVKISRYSTLPMTCFFPTSCMFPCHQLTEDVSPPQLRRKSCNFRVKGRDSNLCCTSSSSDLLCHVVPSSSKEVTFFPCENGLRRGKRSHLAWCEASSVPPLTWTGNKSVTCVMGMIFPGEHRNFGLDTEISWYGNFVHS